MNLEAALATLFEPAPAGLAERVGARLGDLGEPGDQYVTVDGPAGSLWVAFGRRGVSFVYAGGDVERAKQAFAARYPDRPLRPAETTSPSATFAAAAHGRAPARRLTYDLSSCSPFQRAVLEKTAEIPRGEVRSYGWIAKEIGHEGAVRAVGTALGRNPVPVLIPCHRVVRSDGHIGNYALGPGVKERLLTTEGVDVAELARLAERGVRYVGSTTTKIFCHPTCSAVRRIQERNRVTFRSAGDAHAAGYRACERCRPAPTPSSTT